jgi:uncharacterized peroxidase-related enzyme
MPRLQAINPETASGKAKKLLDKVQAKLGMTPNILRTMANSPAVLEAYLGFSTALKGGLLPAKLREQIALAVSEANGCEYCLAAHSAVGKMVGLSEEDILDSRHGGSPDSKVEAALRFASQMVEKRGWVSDEDVVRLRSAGYEDAEIAEIVANVALIMFTNYFNHVAETVVDFPPVPGSADRSERN